MSGDPGGDEREAWWAAAALLLVSPKKASSALRGVLTAESFMRCDVDSHCGTAAGAGAGAGDAAEDKWSEGGDTVLRALRLAILLLLLPPPPPAVASGLPRSSTLRTLLPLLWWPTPVPVPASARAAWLSGDTLPARVPVPATMGDVVLLVLLLVVAVPRCGWSCSVGADAADEAPPPAVAVPPNRLSGPSAEEEAEEDMSRGVRGVKPMTRSTAESFKSVSCVPVLVKLTSEARVGALLVGELPGSASISNEPCD